MTWPWQGCPVVEICLHSSLRAYNSNLSVRAYAMPNLVVYVCVCVWANVVRFV